MIAAKARAAAGYNAEETFTYYVDPSSGSDSHAGSKAAPFASLQHALSTMSAGQSVGLKAGTTNRLTAGITSVPLQSRVGCYGCLPGAANMPIITGGQLASGTWTGIANGGTGGTQPAVVQDAGGLFTSGAAPTATLGSTPTVGNTLLCLIATGNATKNLPTGFTSVLTYNNIIIGSRTVQSGDGKTWAGSVGSGAASSIVLMEISNYGGVDQIADQTDAAPPFTTPAITPTWANSLALSVGAFSITSTATISQSTSGWTTILDEVPVSGWGLFSASHGSPTSGSSMAGPTWTGTNLAVAYAVTLNIYPANGTPNAVSSYSIPFTPASGNAPSFAGFTTGGVTTPLAPATSVSALTTDSYYFSSNVLYVNLGGTNPSTGTVEAAVWSVFNDTTDAHHLQTFRGIAVRYGWDYGISQYNSHGHIADRCDVRYTGQVSSGISLSFANYNNGSLPAYFSRMARCNIQNAQGTAVYCHAIPNLQIDHLTISHLAALSTVIADGIQIEDTAGDSFTYHSSAGLWIHHNAVDMSDSLSPKGCILYNGFGGGPNSTVDGGLIEHNVCTGGNWGTAATASNTTVRYNTHLNQSTQTEGAFHVAANDLQDSLYFYGNLIVAPQNSLSSGGNGLFVAANTNDLTNWIIANNTIVNAARVGINIQSPVSGEVINNIVYWTTGSPTTAAFIQENDGLSELALSWDYSLVNDNLGYRGVGSGGSFTTYSTFAAWKTGTGFDTHGLTSDPNFNNPSSGDYTLAPGSPAIGAGAAVSIPAGGIVWGQQLPAVTIPAGGNLGAF